MPCRRSIVSNREYQNCFAARSLGARECDPLMKGLVKGLGLRPVPDGGRLCTHSNPGWTYGAVMAAIVSVLTALMLVLASAVPASHAIAETSATPIELTSALLDHWVAAMREIGRRNEASAPVRGIEQMADPTALQATCRTAGFASPDECGCTVLYVAVLMNGFDSEAKAFIDPALAIEHKILATADGTDIAPAELEANLRRDRRMLFALRKALPNGVPAEHLALLGDYIRTHMSADVAPWRELAIGMKALETRAIGDRCTKLPALTTPEK